MNEPALILEINEEGRAELRRHGRTEWASDTDTDVLEEFETDFFEDEDGEDLIDYLVNIGLIHQAEAETVVIESPRGPDDDNDEDEDEDELEDERI